MDTEKPEQFLLNQKDLPGFCGSANRKIEVQRLSAIRKLP